MRSLMLENTAHIVTVFLVFLVFVCTPVIGAEPVLSFDTEEQAELYLELTKSHRCLKCQNQNLADSGAGIAQDLKREIYERVVRGETGPEISNYLVTRYGDFVRYKPLFKPNTYILWLGPFLLLVVAVVYAMRMSRRSNVQQNYPDSDTLARARKLLDD